MMLFAWSCQDLFTMVIAGTLEPWLAVNGTNGCERAISEESSKGKVASKAVTSALLYQGYLKPGGDPANGGGQLASASDTDFLWSTIPIAL